MADLVNPTEDPAERLTAVVELAHRHLGLDAAFVSEFTHGGQECRALAGDAGSFGVALGDRLSAEDSFSARMVAGQIPNIVPDAPHDRRVADLPSTARARVGAYIGVPLHLPDGTVYGSLCGVSHTGDRSLNDRDVHFLELLADLLAGDLREQRQQADRHDTVAQVIAHEDLGVACQPVVDLRDGQVIGLEALARFPAPLRPDETFLDAHRVGLGLQLERLAVHKAREMVPRLRGGQFLSINVSPEAALPLAREAHLRTDVPLDQLVLEITEHTAVGSYPELRTELADLRRRGLRIGIDDAGAGYASLRHVVELEPEFIKIDRSLVDGIAADRARRIAMSSFILLALDLRATIVAEGVETEQDLSALCDLGVDAAQGYLLAKPSADPADIDAWTSGGRVTMTAHAADGNRTHVC